MNTGESVCPPTSNGLPISFHRPGVSVASQKFSRQPSSSSHTDKTPRSKAAQMEELDGVRLKVSPEDSLASSLAEPINLEDSHYSQLRCELESDAQNLEAESWSVAVDQDYLKTLSKEAVKRQDVIYELIQTEMHHVRTLKILYYVYMHELKQSFLMEEAGLERLFTKVEALIYLHQHFLNCLKELQVQSQEEGSTNNYLITQLGDVLIAQFSGRVGEQMMESYSIFCSHHSEAISFYKEKMQNNKKLPILIRKIGQLPLVRRLGIPECFLLVTQRITKYPVLVERIIQNTEADTDEHSSLVKGLELIKDTISQVDANVSECEKAARLREISIRLEPKTPGRLKDGRLFRREDLIHGNRMLLHEGTVTLKSSGRQKDVLAVLLSDVLLLLQEKDQKFVFAAMDNKPPVISLQRLIVREVAHEGKALYLICACTTSSPEMYEIHTGSKEECLTWMTVIRKAVERLPEEEQYNELISILQRFQDILKVKDDQIKQSLTEKQQSFATLYKYVTKKETPHKGLLLRGDSSDLQQGEELLNEAIEEVENLQNLLFMMTSDPNHPTEESVVQGGPLRRAETLKVVVDNAVATTMNNGDAVERPESSEGTSLNSREAEETHYTEGLEQSADDEIDDVPVPNCGSNSSHFIGTAVYDSVLALTARLYSLKAIIAQQDSRIGLQQAFQAKNKQPVRHYNNVLLEQEKQRNLEKQKEELANLHKLQTQQQEEQQRWEKERERQRIQMEVQETELKRREEEFRKWEEILNKEKSELERQRDSYQQDLERLRESTRIVDKENERLTKERERLEKLKSKLFPNSGHSNYDDPAQFWSLSAHSSFRGSIVNGGGTPTSTSKAQTLPVNASNPMEIPPKVPPRKESISPQPFKSELPMHLISTTNQVQKPAVVQQKIPTKLAIASKGKERSFKGKRSHQRAHSAASIDVNQVLPIRVVGKEGGSLKSKRNDILQRSLYADTFKPPGSPHSVRTSQSFSTGKWSSSSSSTPPTPPPFPKDVLEKGKDKVIFF
ncbi:rho guanine nucleotide exchange factor 18a isoform X2 [Leuresthes tenuis]|uniref:rho guanine nucleotide exchange factor 18a isoform X2 n=1 Tax=Leuresthes tenuis TaxID=355514 RepID=UPI003B508BF3